MSFTLITGASSGIGLELARVFARRGHDLVVSARREPQLRELADRLAAEVKRPIAVEVVPADLAEPAGPAALAEAIADRGIEVEVLVNNAGQALSGRMQDMTLDDILRVVDLNVRSLTELTQRLLPGMLARGSGRILNVASVAAFQAVPGFSVYGATKAYVLSLSEALSEELRGTGVSVTALCPGLTKTEMVDDVHDRPIPEFLMASARDVALEGYNACMAGEAVRIPGPIYQALVSWLQVQPRWAVRFFSGIAARTSFR